LEHFRILITILIHQNLTCNLTVDTDVSLDFEDFFEKRKIKQKLLLCRVLNVSPEESEANLNLNKDE
jgi:hypothetical protein